MRIELELGLQKSCLEIWPSIAKELSDLPLICRSKSRYSENITYLMRQSSHDLHD
jgi:hypothetical protein